ncbi:MAG: copper homeostasis protein CutC [Bacteroidetes bacterium]|nr:copper homeostasis protein CutC [Bacteroidota bacterium]
MTKPIVLEICAPSLHSAINADLAGADRIELCQNLNEGGTTPSFGNIKYCVDHLKLKTNVLIRPRSGDFCYSDEEFHTIQHDVELCKVLGVHGVVVGFLNEDLTIDIEKTRKIVEIATPMSVTFHRAFDICKDWNTALEQIISCGCNTILTSGTRKTAYEGIQILKEIVQKAQNRITILAGSGINPSNASEIIEKTGVQEIHSSCTRSISNSNGSPEVEKLLDESNIYHKESDIDLIKKILSLQIINKSKK